MNLLMNPDQLLNAITSPTFGQNARRKWLEKDDTQTVAAGLNTYQFFQEELGEQFERNARFPISGNEVFFVTDIKLYTTGVKDAGASAGLTTGNFAALDEILGRSFLVVSVNDRVQLKIPLLEILNFGYQQNLIADTNWKFNERKRSLLYPIIMNSNANVSYEVVLSADALTQLVDADLRLILYGIQFDKLDTFYYDVWQGKRFQKIDYTLYQAQEITTANQTTYNLFQNQQLPISDYSKFLPLSDIERFDVNALEIGYFNSDTSIDILDLYNNKRDNILQVVVEDVTYFTGYVRDFMSISQVSALVDKQIWKQNLTLKVPISLPAKGNVKVLLTQPGLSACVNDYFVMLMKGVLTRQVV